MPVPLFVLVSSSSARVHSCLYLDCQFLREGFDLLRFLPKFSATGDLKGLQTVKKLSRFYCCDEGHRYRPTESRLFLPILCGCTTASHAECRKASQPLAISDR